MARLKLNHGEIGAFLKGPEVQSWVNGQAETIASRCGPGFVVYATTKGTRARAYVRPDTYKARLRQARNHVIERAAGGGF